MSVDTTFISRLTNISAAWLNSVNRFVNDAQNAANPALGSALIAYLTGKTGGKGRILSEKLMDDLPSVFDFLSALQIADVQSGTLALDCSAAWQAFLNAGGGTMPPGKYLCNTPLVCPDGARVFGAGTGVSVLVTTLDIEQVVTTGNPFHVLWRDLCVQSNFPVSNVAGPSTTGNPTNGNSDVPLTSIAGITKGIQITGAGIPANSYVRKISGNTISLGDSNGNVVTATGTAIGVSISTIYRQGPTHYQFHILNGAKWVLDNVKFFTAFGDHDYSPLNHAGCWFDRTNASTASYVNLVKNCWFHHSQLYMGTGDSDVEGNTIWGNPFDFALKTSAPSIRVSGGSISAGVLEGHWVTASATEPNGANNQLVCGVNYDAGNLWYTGVGLRADQPVGLTVEGGCHFTNVNQAGIVISNSVGCSIDASFLNCNAENNGWDDIQVISSVFQTAQLRIKSNFTRTNSTLGYAINELAGSFYPQQGNYSGSVISGGSQYTAPGINVSTPIASGQYPTIMGMSGVGNQNQGNLLLGTILPIQGMSGFGFGNGGLALQASNPNLAANGTLDFPVNMETFGGSPGGFVGTLAVSATRNNLVTSSTRTLYAVMAHGSTGVFTSLGTQNGSGSGSAFTLTMFGNGNIRFTDTSGQITNVSLAFFGSKSAA